VTNPCHVYAICNTGHKLCLRVMFTGTRYKCMAHITNRAKNNQPTHFLRISSMGVDAAERKFLP